MGGDKRRNRQSSQAEKRATDVSMDVVLQANKAETGG